VPIDATRTLRGAVAGAAAAGVWAAQSPLDQRLFGVRYDDTELLGKAITRGPAWRALGNGAHVLNGALFGAAYANAAPSIPAPAWARGPLAGIAQGLAMWPLTQVVDRVHPARQELPRLWGNRAAFSQMLWRHLLFGALLGELERRLNPPEEPPPTVAAAIVSTNGHGRVEDLAGATADG
jgi:hypothetical protein